MFFLRGSVLHYGPVYSRSLRLSLHHINASCTRFRRQSVDSQNDYRSKIKRAEYDYPAKTRES